MGLQLGEEEDFGQAFKYEDLARDLSAKYPKRSGATRAYERHHLVQYALQKPSAGYCGIIALSPSNAGRIAATSITPVFLRPASCGTFRSRAGTCLLY